MINKRNSSIELLRIICILGIITMHLSGVLAVNYDMSSIVILHIVNAVFNVGVSVFALISGYYGIKTSVNRVVMFECTLMFYSVLSFVIGRVCDVNPIVGGREILKVFLPMYSYRHWYLTVYLVLIIMADFINLISERLDKKLFEKLLITLLILFVVMPTIIQLDLTRDGGKGIINVTIMYLLGRYIRKYNVHNSDYKKKYLSIFVTCLGISMVLNVGMSIIRQLHFFIYSRDCSIFIVIMAISIFLFFMSFKLDSRLINSIAKHVIGVYLFEGTAGFFVRKYCFDVMTLYDKWYFLFLLLIYLCLVYILCMLVNLVRLKLFAIGQKVLYRPYNYILAKVEDLWLGKIGGAVNSGSCSVQLVV